MKINNIIPPVSVALFVAFVFGFFTEVAYHCTPPDLSHTASNRVETCRKLDAGPMEVKNNFIFYNDSEAISHLQKIISDQENELRSLRQRIYLHQYAHYCLDLTTNKPYPVTITINGSIIMLVWSNGTYQVKP